MALHVYEQLSNVVFTTTRIFNMCQIYKHIRPLLFYIRFCVWENLRQLQVPIIHVSSSHPNLLQEPYLLDHHIKTAFKGTLKVYSIRHAWMTGDSTARLSTRLLAKGRVTPLWLRRGRATREWGLLVYLMGCLSRSNDRRI